jgi:hypothetical protein
MGWICVLCKMAAERSNRLAPRLSRHGAGPTQPLHPLGRPGAPRAEQASTAPAAATQAASRNAANHDLCPTRPATSPP